MSPRVPKHPAPLRRSRLRLGAHMSIAGGLHRALQRGADAGCDVIQIFVRSNQQWATAPLDPEQVDLWHDARRRTGVYAAMVHGSYLINLSARRHQLRERSYRTLALEYARAALLGIPYYVIHPGAHVGRGEADAIRHIAHALDRLFDAQPANPTMLLLENTAGQGTCIGNRFEHLRDIFALVRAPARLGICIDTCHLLAAGYDLRSAAAWEATFATFDRMVGCQRIRAFHVNDSKAPLGSRVDRHEHIGRGSIGLSGFRCLVNDPRFVGLPMLLETPKPIEAADRVNLEILRALHGRQRVGSLARALSRRPFAPPIA